MARKAPTTAREALDAIRDALADVLDKHDDCGREASRVLRAVGVLEQTLRQAPGLGEYSATESEGQPKPRGRYKPKRYAVRKVGNREMLCEFRVDSDVPFRCPKSTLDAVAKVVAGADRPMSFNEIEDGVNELLPEPAATYQIRVCLRFLSSADLELVRRNRARFAAMQPNRLQRSVASAWRALSGRS
jgi:hypothetical protein